MKNSETYSFNRWVPFITCLVLQLCMGSAFIWGVFQPGIVENLSWSQKNAALTFSVLFSLFALGSAIGGLIQDRMGPELVIPIGGFITAAGFFLASFSDIKSPWYIWITYSLILSFGSGFVYNTAIVVCQKWFPDKREFITGILVSASSIGGLIFTPILLLLSVNLEAIGTSIWFAIFFILVSVTGAYYIKNPPPGYRPDGWTPTKKTPSSNILNYNPLQVIKTPQLYILGASVVLAGAAGLMVIPYNKVLGLSGGLTDFVSMPGVMFLFLFYSLGSLFWSWISVKFTRKRALIMLMVIIGISILLITAAKAYIIVVLVSLTLIDFCYGGLLSILPAVTSNYWGTKYLGTNYGMVLLSLSIGAIASTYITGQLKDMTGTFIIPFITASMLAFFGAFLIFLLKKPQLRTNQVILQDSNYNA